MELKCAGSRYNGKGKTQKELGKQNRKHAKMLSILELGILNTLNRMCDKFIPTATRLIDTEIWKHYKHMIEQLFQEMQQGKYSINIGYYEYVYISRTFLQGLHFSAQFTNLRTEASKGQINLPRSIPELEQYKSWASNPRPLLEKPVRLLR